MGVDFHVRGKRTDEMIAAMRELWNSDAASFSGDFFRFKGAYCYPKPARHVPILVGGESKPAMRRVARLGDGWLPYNLPVEEAPRVIGDLKAMTRAEGRDPEALRIIKIVYSNARLDDLKRYRDAGVTEFNVASSGEIPLDDGGIKAKFAEYAETIAGPIAEL
jgi:alkanesulfonate monooxygenase SsuD/methylene tetrahydromethanopterin reductase-like flavin-dependent oxidoreductase (luciferase family)